jgi:hypothetical protein
MDNVVYVPVAEGVYREISKLLEKIGSQRSVNSTIQQFVEYGLDNAGWKTDVFFPEAENLAAVSEREGYKWKHPEYRKPLFLPNGSQFRMEYDGEYHYAAISKGILVYKGEIYKSPSQLASLIAGGTSRSAPRDFFVKRPNDSEWSQALVLFKEENF